MKSNSYPPALRAKMVKKLLGPNPVSVSTLSEETGIHQTTLSRWMREAANVGPMSSGRNTTDDSPSKRPEDWTAQEKLEAVMAAAALGEAELGAFLRKRGLHRETLDQWRLAALESLGGGTKRRRGRTDEQKRIQNLERDLRRKEKALAEAAALLVLQKKARRLLWADEGDDTDGSSDE